jgi:hypothetical protein
MTGLTALDQAGLDALDGDRLWSAVCAAAAGSRAGAAGTVARLCRAGGSPRLGWVHPPPWPVVAGQLSAIAAGLRGPAVRRVVVLGTGGWSFAGQALTETTDRGTVAVLDSLDPAAIRRRLPAAPGAAGYLAVSGSGTTVETRLLADAAATCAPGPLVWLRDLAGPPAGFPLSPRGLPDQVAMLGAPLSTAFLAPAQLLDRAGLAGAYERLAGSYHRLGAEAARLATAVPADRPVELRYAVPGWAGAGLRRWLLQLGRQVLAGKSSRFRPEVGIGENAGGTLDLRGFQRGLPGLLELLYTAGVFTACLGLRAGLEVAEHRHVRAYKDLLAAEPTEPAPATMDELPRLAAEWLAGRPELRRLHVVHYWSAAPDGAARFTAATGRPCEVHEGSAWNHHSFQATYADPHAAVLLVTRATSGGEPDHPALAAAAGALARIAHATHLALPDRSRLVRLAGGGD